MKTESLLPLPRDAAGLRRKLLGSLACVCVCMSSLTACTPAPTSAAAQPAGVKRTNNVMPPSLTLTPATLTLQAGASTTLTAHTQGGEAMLFTVDWKILEGASAGTISSDNKRSDDGSYTASYTAPAASGVTAHIVASLHEYPAASATAAIQVK
jgi:hypothetical protein